jgi:pimeloyl-ACP methyl ester carboxylesterase
MTAQTRTVLGTYGNYREMVIPDSGHAPHLDQPAAFRAALAEHLTSSG